MKKLAIAFFVAGGLVTGLGFAISVLAAPTGQSLNITLLLATCVVGSALEIIGLKMLAANRQAS